MPHQPRRGSPSRDHGQISTATTLLRLALTKLVEIVGEAAKRVSEEGRAEFPNVPWSAAARMRDRLVHHYFDIDLDVLWNTVVDDRPGLLSQLGSGDDVATGQ